MEEQDTHARAQHLDGSPSNGDADGQPEGLLGAEEAGDDFVRCLAGAVLGLMTNFAGHFPSALEQVEDAIAVADGEGTGNAHRFPLCLYKAGLLLDVVDLEGAQCAVERGRRLSEQLGTAWNLPMYHLVSAVGLFWSGAWDD